MGNCIKLNRQFFNKLNKALFTRSQVKTQKYFIGCAFMGLKNAKK